MRQKPNYLKITVLAYAAAIHCIAAVFLVREVGPRDTVLACMIGGILLALLAGHFFDFFCRRALSYRVSAFLKLLLLAVLRDYLAPRPVLDCLLTGSLVLDLGIYEDYPWNLAAGLFTVVALALTDQLVPAGRGFPLALLPDGALAASASLMSRYRESLIDTQEYSTRIEDALLKLNRATRDYQDCLLRVGAESTEKERRRITNDIHDIVGYALTNNIVLMEAATDMMRTDPLGVSRMITMARTNAEEGLREIRKILYRFRDSPDGIPKGLAAIARVVEIFRSSTSIPVRLEYGNLPWSFGREVDYALQHLIQESMINSLRHGRSTAIRILMGIDDGFLHVEIWDNGTGADEVKEGIGLSGMRERIEKLGGTVRFGNMEGGFAVRAFLPVLPETEGG